MPTSVIIAKRLMLTFEEGSYSFSKFEHTATDEQIYGLAMDINALQNEPAKAVNLIVRSEIV